MAQKVQVLLVCDLHEDEAEGRETVTFSVDGASYEIDVCDEHARDLRDAFAPYVGAARRASRTGGANRSGRRGSGARSSARGVSEVREWARKNGHQVSERGRISSVVQQAYDAAH